MLLKRQYGEDGKVASVLVKHTGLSPAQNFSRRLVEQALVDGWMRLEGASLVIKADPEDLVYTLKRSPGYYCVSTGERMPISEVAWSQLLTSPGGGVLGAREAAAWLQANGKAAGDYEITMAYECVLGDAQHEKFRAVRDAAGNPVAAQTVEA